MDESATDTAEFLTQAGWLAKGFVFVVIGVLGLELARRGYSGEDADQTGALAALAELPLGQLLVLAVGVGLALFSIWKAWSAIVDSSTSLLAILQRIGSLGLAVVYGLLAVTALQMGAVGATAESSGSGASSPEDITAILLDLPLGRLLVLVVGLGTIAVGAYHVHKGATFEFLDEIDSDDLDQRQRLWLRWLGLSGFLARSATLGITGSLFIHAAWTVQPDRAAGLDQSLRWLIELPAGRILLGFAAAGLLGAGVYDMVTFRRQRLGGG